MVAGPHSDTAAVPQAVPSGIEVRGYRPGDEAQILVLFRRVFGIERSLQHWRWKFADNPVGQELSLAWTKGGELVGQFAGLPVRAVAESESFILTQGIDNMVDPAYQGKGVFAALVRHFIESYLPPGRPVLFYGYNLARKHEIDKRVFRMELVHPVLALRFDLTQNEARRVSPAAGGAAGVRRRLGALGVRVERVARFDATADELWLRSRTGLACAAVRDAAYLNWRYADCPDVEYALLCVRGRFSRRLRGVAVLRMGWFDEPIAALVDWLVPPGDEAASLGLVTACHELARERRLTAVKVWFPPAATQHQLFLGLGYVEEPTPFLVSVWNDGHSEERVSRFKESWYYTMGDSDIY
jgi:GNAT superfamily N-acetyltransferase